MTARRISVHHFDESYLENVELDGIGRLILRLIRPEDKALLVAGLHQLSQRSQYLRFFSPKGDRIEHLIRRLSPQVTMEILDSDRIRTTIPLTRHGC